jgi:hypothetical protein
MSRTRRKGRHTAYTHPVLGNGEDFPGQRFQAGYQMKRTPAGWELECSIQCCNQHIADLVKEGRAVYKLDFDCPAVPFSRVAIDSASPEFKVTIPRDDVCHEVSILAAVVATTNIAGYAPPGRNKAFRGARDILKNEFLAVDPAGRQNFNVNGGIGCLIRVRRAKDPKQRLATFFGDSQFFWVTLPQKDYDLWTRVKRDDPELDRNLLGPAFLQPALMEALGSMEDQPDADWARSLRGIMREKGLDPERDPASKSVQVLLDKPISRACRQASNQGEKEQ